jgi:hypothetical protein
VLSTKQAVRLLAASGGAATLNMPESQTGSTPLLLAMGPRRSTELVKLLIDSGADVNKYNYRIETPLMLATELPLAKLLLDAGSAVNAVCITGATPLHKAAEQGCSAGVICCLLKAGADATATDHEGLVAAAVATKSGHTATAALLRRAADDQRSKLQQQQQREWQRQQLLDSVSAVLECTTLLPRSGTDLVVGSWRCAERDYAVRRQHLSTLTSFMYNSTEGYQGGDLLARARAAVEQATKLEAAVYSCATSFEAYADSEAWQRKVLQAQRWLTIAPTQEAAAAAVAAAAAAAASPLQQVATRFALTGGSWRCDERDRPVQVRYLRLIAQHLALMRSSVLQGPLRLLKQQPRLQLELEEVLQLMTMLLIQYLIVIAQLL